MKGFYVPILATHVVVAVLGLGSVASVALIAAAGRKEGHDSTDFSPWLALLLRYSGLSLALMLVTGILLDLAAGGAFHELIWFRASAILLVVTGALHGMARRASRPGGTLVRVERLAYVMCLFLAVITILMEVKPFR